MDIGSLIDFFPSHPLGEDPANPDGPRIAGRRGFGVMGVSGTQVLIYEYEKQKFLRFHPAASFAILRRMSAGVSGKIELSIHAGTLMVGATLARMEMRVFPSPRSSNS